MSNLCFWICVLFICAILCNEVSESHGVKDYRKSDVKKDTNVDSVNIYKFHPFLKNIELSNDMVSLLDGLKRNKRLTHHGFRKNGLRTLRKGSYRAACINNLEPPAFSRHEKLKKTFISNGCKRRKRVTQHVNDYLQENEYENKTPEKKIRHYAASPISKRSRQHDTVSNSRLRLKKRGTSQIGNGGPAFKLEPTFSRRNDHTFLNNKYGKLLLKRDVTDTLNANDAVSTTMSVSSSESIVSITANNSSQNQTTGSINNALPSTMDADTTPKNETCDKDVPCNMGNTLEEILQAVDEIAHEKSAKNTHEDFPCEVNGSWVTEAGGVRLDISVANNSQLNIAQYDTVPLKTHPGFLCNDTWILNGTVPLNNSGIIMITGVNSHDKRVATFIGECKVCKHKETIAGHWLYVRQARDCSDEKNSYQILSDLWIRESLHTMRKQRLEMLRPGATQVIAKTVKQGSTATSTGTTTAGSATTAGPKPVGVAAAESTASTGSTAAGGSTTVGLIVSGSSTSAGVPTAGASTPAGGSGGLQTTAAAASAMPPK